MDETPKVEQPTYSYAITEVVVERHQVDDKDHLAVQWDILADDHTTVDDDGKLVGAVVVRTHRHAFEVGTSEDVIKQAAADSVAGYIRGVESAERNAATHELTERAEAMQSLVGTRVDVKPADTTNESGE